MNKCRQIEEKEIEFEIDSPEEKVTTFIIDDTLHSRISYSAMICN